MKQKDIYRIIDVNVNRCKEGLRVVEDILRFAYCDSYLRKKIRAIRHRLNAITKENTFLHNLISSRDVQKDPGKKLDLWETGRENTLDILFINLQRAKESLRVLEEFFKLIDIKKAGEIKLARYELYSLEKKIITKWSNLRNSR